MDAIVSEDYWRKRPKGTPKDLTGETYENLTVIGLSHRIEKLGRYIWRCRCKCGNEIDVSTGDWNGKRAKSCGCYRSRTGPDHPNYRHGKKVTWHKTGLRKNYGITPEQYESMVQSQNGKCAICGGTNNAKRLHVDHCHTSGKIRGLLCTKCNTGLGMFNDNVETMSSAIKYLSSNGE